MEEYSVKCPACGAMNQGLFLKETDGWFICERYKLEIQAQEFSRITTIPEYTIRQVAELAKQS